MKRFIITAVLLGFATIAKAYDFQAGDLLYSIINTSPPQVTLDGHIDGMEAQGELVIPMTVEYENETYSVVAISRRSFYHCHGLTGDLIIPNSVTFISIESFSYCTGFTGSLVISNAIVEIGTNDLQGGASFEGAFEGCKGFTRLVLGESLQTIGSLCFSGCSGFTGKLALPDGLKEIRTLAFAGCCGFNEALDLPDSLETIESNAFNACSGFTGKLVFPDALRRIGNDAFAWCSGFTDVRLSHQVFYQQGFGDGVFTGWGLETIDIPEGWRTTGQRTFSACNNLRKVSLPNSLASIGSHAFEKCYHLCEMVLPDSLRSIEAGAFAGCGQLKDLCLPCSLTVLGSGAFRCTGLSGVLAIPDLVERIELHTFDSCVHLRKIVLGKSVNFVAEPAFRNTHLDSLIVKALTPPELRYFTVSVNIPSDLPIIVPCESSESYQNAEGWKNLNINRGITTLFSAKSSDETAGTVIVLNEASCENPSVQVEATPEDGFVFLYWEAHGEHVSYDNPYSFELNDDTELLAYFSGVGLDEDNILISLHPNPTTGLVAIAGEKLKAAEAFNALGQRVATATGKGEMLQIDLSGLPAGLYFVSITDEDGRKCVRKVVKE